MLTMLRIDARADERRAFALFDRLALPILGLVTLAAIVTETRRPLRRRTAPRRDRWPTNAAIGALGAAVARLAILPAMVHTAHRYASRGLLGRLRLPPPLRSLLAFALLDYSLYWWHRANHQVGFLWRFHAAHHVDPDLDVTTAFRFHTVELLLSIPVRCAFAAAVGVSPRQVVVYEAAMQAATIFHHTNVRLPRRAEGLLSAALITPSLHGTHHSQRAEELASSFGVVLSTWDRLHRTRRLTAQDRVHIGVPSQPRSDVTTHIVPVLMLPFRSSTRALVASARSAS